MPRSRSRASFHSQPTCCRTRSSAICGLAFVALTCLLRFAAAAGDRPVSGIVIFTAHATDENRDFDTITLYVDDEPTLSSSEPPYHFELNTRTLSEGRHLVWVEARRGATRVGASRRLALAVTHTGISGTRPGPTFIRLNFSTADYARGEAPAATARPPRAPRHVRARGPVTPAPPRPAPASLPSAAPPRKSSPPPARPTPPVAKVAPPPTAPPPAKATPPAQQSPPVAKVLPPAKSTSPAKVASPALPRASAKTKPSPPTRSKSKPIAPPPRPTAPPVRTAPPRSAEAVQRVIVIYAFAVALVMALLAVATVFDMRARLLMTISHRRQYLATWRPLLLQTLDDKRANEPENILRRRMAIRAAHQAKADWLTFLHLWNHLHESQRLKAHMRLNEVGHIVGVHQVALRMLANGDARDRLMAIATLGNLDEASAFEPLHELAARADPFLSLAAARSLIHLDPRESMSVLMPLISERADWAPTKLASILREAGTDVMSGTDIISASLAAATLDAPPESAPRMIRLLTLAGCDSAAPTVRELLERTPDDERVVSVCLQTLSDPTDLPALRNYLGHSNPHLRMEAVIALGRVGVEEDAQRMIELLDDDEWWVRYRAARALAQQPFATPSFLERVRDEQDEERAKEMIDRVLAERQSA